jgi:hypothetical protein
MEAFDADFSVADLPLRDLVGMCRHDDGRLQAAKQRCWRTVIRL